MRTCGFSVPRHGQRTRPASPAAAPGRRRRIASPAAWLPVLALVGCAVLAGCASLEAALHTSVALQSAGYQNANVNVSTGDELPAGGQVSVTYSSGPAGNDQRDVQGAEKIVWDTFSQHFGTLTIVKVSGGCTGPVCVSHSTELASVTYAQLAARFGARPQGADKASPGLPGWAVPVGAAAGVVGFVAIAAIVVTLIVRRKRRKGSRPPAPPPWPAWPPPGPQAGWPSGYPYQAPGPAPAPWPHGDPPVGL